MGFFFFVERFGMQHNKFLVMDSGGFIRGFHMLDQFYSEYEMSTIQEVIYEIRDRKTRTKLESGVFEVHLRGPHPDALQRTIDFCKATGDYAALSAVDIKVIALAVSTEMDKNGMKYLKEIPPIPQFAQARPIADTKKNPLEALTISTTDKKKTQTDIPNATKEESNVGETPEQPVVENSIQQEEEEKCTDIETENNKDNDNEDEFEEEADDEEDRVFVACCTTDFAMQNVLLQMGIKILSVDGLQIGNIRNWTLRCFACMRVSPERDRIFCKFCGNKTLRKISIFIDESGEVKYVNPRRELTSRGTKFSIPKPKPGRANQPNSQFIVTEHQYQRFSKGANKKRDLDLMMDSEFDFSRKTLEGKSNPGLARGNPNKVKRTSKNKRNRRRR